MAELLEDAEIERKVRKYITDAREHTTVDEQKDRAVLHQDMMRGGKHQWSEDEYQAYISKGVTPVSINRCKPVLKGLVGMYLQNQQEVRVRPRRGGSATVAQVHTEIAKHTQDLSYADYIYAQVFMRGGVDTEAYLRYKVDHGENPSGQPVITARSLWDVSVDRNATEYDLNDSAKYVIDREWKDKEEIEAMYPEHAENGNIAGTIHAEDEFGERAVTNLVTYMTTEGGSHEDGIDEEHLIPDSDQLKKYRYLVEYVYWKELKPEIVVYDRQNDQSNTITNEKKIIKIRRKAKRSVRFNVVSVPRKVLHETVMLGPKLLEDNIDPLGPGVSDYPITRFSPLWDMGYAMGFMDDSVSLNKEENVHRTESVRIVKQTANSGWLVGSSNDIRAMATLKNYGAVSGVVLDKSKFGGLLEKIMPNPVPQGYFTLGAQFELDVKRVSGVDDATLGYETGGGTESGKAIGLKQAGNRRSSEMYFSNFYHTLEIFGNMMIKAQMANKHYTDDEIRAIVDESSLLDSKLIAKARFQLTQQLGGADLPQPQPLPPMDPMMLQNPVLSPQDKLRMLQTVEQGAKGAAMYAQAYPQLNTAWEDVIKTHAIEMLLDELREDKGLYGMKVAISPSAPTERMARWIQMDSLMSKYGQIIPVDVFIDLMDLPQGDEIKARIAQNQQAQQAQVPGQVAA